VTDPATIVELSSARWKKPLPTTKRKFSSVGLSGMYSIGVWKSSFSTVKADLSAHRNGNTAYTKMIPMRR
jgi:hypothetical protein